MSPTFFSDIYIGITATITATLPPKQYLHRHFTPTFTPTRQQQPSAFTDQLQIDYFRKIIPKGIRTGEKGITPYYIQKSMWKMVGITLLNISNLSVSLCKLRHFHYASCGYFIVQVVAISLCKLWIYPKKMVFHSSK